MRAKDLTGKKYGHLTALEMVRVQAKKRIWLCECDCGVLAEVRTSDLTTGQQLSCGCYKAAVMAKRNKLTSTTHGKSQTGAYQSWGAMRARCMFPHSISYRWYGAKGVRVCDRWQNFESFLEDMGERPEGMSIDRIDPYGDYEPNNCRWATAKEQAENRRAAQA